MIHHLYTGIETEAFRWNEEAADELSNMVWDVDMCSRQMGLVNALIPKKPPKNFKPSWRWWLTNFIGNLAKEADLLNKGYVNKACMDQTILKYKDAVRRKLIK